MNQYGALIYINQKYVPLVGSAHQDLFKTIHFAEQWHANNLDQPLPQIINVNETDLEYFSD